MYLISRDIGEENDIPVFRAEGSIKQMSVLKQKDEQTV
jgi:hypothetical protein